MQQRYQKYGLCPPLRGTPAPAAGTSFPSIAGPPGGFAERGRACPPSLHFVAPLTYPPSPLRGYPPRRGCGFFRPLKNTVRTGFLTKHRPGRVAAKRRGRRGIASPPLRETSPPHRPLPVVGTASHLAVVPCFSCVPQRASPPVAGCPQMHSPDGRGLSPPHWRGSPRCTSRCI